MLVWPTEKVSRTSATSGKNESRALHSGNYCKLSATCKFLFQESISQEYHQTMVASLLLPTQFNDSAFPETNKHLQTASHSFVVATTLSTYGYKHIFLLFMTCGSKQLS